MDDLWEEMDKLYLWMEANPEQVERDMNQQFEKNKPMDIQDIMKQLRDNNISDKTESSFFPLKTEKRCTNRGHNIPSHMVIPQGQGYRHVCPGCGEVQIVIPQQYTL